MDVKLMMMMMMMMMMRGMKRYESSGIPCVIDGAS